jgi:hypothetical protein
VTDSFFLRSVAHALAVLSVLAASAGVCRAERPIDFNREIKPLLSRSCIRCHGPDPGERKGGKGEGGVGGLRLDTSAGAREDLGGYAAVVPGHPESSALIARVTSTDADERMPPADSGKGLSAAEIDLLKEWIRQGAEYTVHWSYAPRVRPAPPAVSDERWVRNPIDRFTLARLDREGLKPSAEADRYALARRVSLDVIGLPPTLEEVDAFVADADPQAYEKLVDRLLARPAFGEYWGQQWLDLARYADSAGYADDPLRTIWLYRDYVIRSLNANKPFDRFTVEQIAGDLLPNPTEEQLTATAFHRNTLTNSEGGTDDEEFRNVAVVDRVNTTMAVWMGTTMACAQCHNHKYDPITQEEYFRFFAFFNQSEDRDRKDEEPLLMVYSEAQQQQRAAWQAELAGLEQTLQKKTTEVGPARERWAAEFPLDLAWQVLVPTAVKSQAARETTIAPDGVVTVAGGVPNDTHTIELAAPAGASNPFTFKTLRLEALADAALPGKGPGHGGGNFVITRLSARLIPPDQTGTVGRFVRIELPGKGRILSLAEVQVLGGNDHQNLARAGAATQSSVDYGGPAELAIDGNTSGDFNAAHSTTHTAVSDDPWWEVDLKAELPLDQIVIWNRTDGGVGSRLAGCQVIVLNAARQPLWQQTLPVAPETSVELSLSAGQTVEFASAVADYSQLNFSPDQVIGTPQPGANGWAIGGQAGRAHTLGLSTKSPVEIAAGWKLVVSIEYASKSPNLTLGRFRLSASSDERAMQSAATPPAVIDALRVPAAERTASQSESIDKHFEAIAPELVAVRGQIAEVNRQLTEMKADTVPVMRELAADKQRVTKIQRRGNFLDVGEAVTAGAPAVFPPLPADVPVGRLALARWLVDESNPLTARVMANRYWEQIFGIGIVTTSEDFGSQGDLPTHAELLDWVASELVESHWDTKALVRLLVTSATYRQSSLVTPALTERDPDNRLLARGPRFRLSAEVVRDQALAVSGLLSSKMYGPPVRPVQPSLGLSAAFGGATDWQTSAGEDRLRRAIYTTWRRSSPYPSMATFDAPNREVCTVRRTRTNTPLQALVTLNDPVYVEAAQALARRMMAGGGTNPEDCARLGFRLCLARSPHETELARLVELYEHSRGRLAGNADAARKLAGEPTANATPTPETNLTQTAAWTVVANVLLNLDEMMMKR